MQGEYQEYFTAARIRNIIFFLFLWQPGILTDREERGTLSSETKYWRLGSDVDYVVIYLCTTPGHDKKYIAVGVTSQVQMHYFQ